MNNLSSLNKRLETAAWGALFIFLGFVSIIPGVPPGTGTLGIGIILLGLNLIRYFSKIPVNGFTMTLGVIATLLGAMVVLAPYVGLPLEGPLFPALLIAIGIYWLITERKSGAEK